MFRKKRRRPERHERITPQGVIIVNPEVSYDETDSLSAERAETSEMNDGLRQEANSAVRELEHVVDERKNLRRQENAKVQLENRKKQEAQLTKLVDIAEKCGSEAATTAENVFDMKAEATFYPESLETEWINPFDYDLNPIEPSYTDIRMSGHVLLGSGENKIKVDVIASARQRDFHGTQTPRMYHYLYNQMIVSDPESLYEAIESERQSSNREEKSSREEKSGRESLWTTFKRGVKYTFTGRV